MVQIKQIVSSLTLQLEDLPQSIAQPAAILTKLPKN